MKRFLLPTLASLMLAACAGGPDTAPAARSAAPERFGLLVMAHGGPGTWNRTVEEAVAPLEAEQPTEIAFGMADADSLAAAVAKLEAEGVTRIGVVRMFISGESFLDRTEQIFGLRDGAPAPAPKPLDAAAHAGHGAGHGNAHAAAGAGGHHNMAFYRLDTAADISLSHRGLMDAPEMGRVLAARALGLSENPGTEDVLILAHGPGDDAENERWLKRIDARADAVRAAAPFRRVTVMTLREDWPDKRAAAEAEVRAFIGRAGAEGGTAIVLPFRLSGFGPYRKVLDGLDYKADGLGLLPHPAVTDWLKAEAQKLAAEAQGR